MVGLAHPNFKSTVHCVPVIGNTHPKFGSASPTSEARPTAYSQTHPIVLLSIFCPRRKDAHVDVDLAEEVASAPRVLLLALDVELV
eukprot:157387-Pyramimonas_sp.AAC.1